MIRAVILDFDGVILESVEAKGRAFVRLLDDYPEHADDIAAFHRQNGGMNRVPKLKAIFAQILRQPLSTERLDVLCTRFAQLVQIEMQQAAFVSGAMEFITQHWQRLHLAIVSATPHEELREIISQKGLAPFFALTLGAPPGKADNLRTVLDMLRLHPDEACFVGDAMADYEGALAVGVPFIGRVDDFNPNPFSGLSIPLIRDLSALAPLIGGQ